MKSVSAPSLVSWRMSAWGCRLQRNRQQVHLPCYYSCSQRWPKWRYNGD